MNRKHINSHSFEKKKQLGIMETNEPTQKMHKNGKKNSSKIYRFINTYILYAYIYNLYQNRQ